MSDKSDSIVTRLPATPPQAFDNAYLFPNTLLELIRCEPLEYKTLIA